MFSRTVVAAAVVLACVADDFVCTFDEYIAKPIENDGNFTFKFHCNRQLDEFLIDSPGFMTDITTTLNEVEVDGEWEYSLVEWVDPRFSVHEPGYYTQVVSLLEGGYAFKFTPEIDFCNKLNCFNYKDTVTLDCESGADCESLQKAYTGKTFQTTVSAQFGVTPDEFAWNELPITVFCANATVSRPGKSTITGREACDFIEGRMNALDYKSNMHVTRDISYSPVSSDIGTKSSACFAFTDNPGAYVAKFKIENGNFISKDKATACVNLQDADGGDEGVEPSTTTKSPGDGDFASQVTGAGLALAVALVANLL